MINWFKRKNKNNKKSRSEVVDDMVKLLKPKDTGINIVYEDLTEYDIRGYRFKLGDKVICRSNEIEPILIGEIVEFWDNEGKWSDCIPYVKDVKGDVFGVMGLIKPYTEELFNEIKGLHPLKQWNHMVGDDVKFHYTDEQIKKKESRNKRG